MNANKQHVNYTTPQKCHVCYTTDLNVGQLVSRLFVSGFINVLCRPEFEKVDSFSGYDYISILLLKVYETSRFWTKIILEGSTSSRIPSYAATNILIRLLSISSAICDWQFVSMQNFQNLCQKIHNKPSNKYHIPTTARITCTSKAMNMMFQYNRPLSKIVFSIS